MAAEQALNPEPANGCCAKWMKKCAKLQEGRNLLRQAVDILKRRVNDLEAQEVNLNKAYQQELARAKTLENEVSGLKSEIAALQQKCGTGAQEENGDVKILQAGISDREKEISRLKELVEKEKIRADSERKIAENEKKKATEARKLLEEEKKISAEKGMQLAKIEPEKVKECRLQQVHLEKEVNETKMKLASEVSKFKEATTRFEAEKQKLLVEKRNAESEMKKAQEQVEVEKQKAAREKQRADAELVKVEEQKKLAADNWKSSVEAKHLADQMSQELVEDKKTIEDMKQKIHQVSQANICDKEKEINRLKELVEEEKIRADFERKIAGNEKKKAAEAWKLLEEEKKISAEKGMQLAKIEVEKAEEYRLQQVHLEKEVTETKKKLAFEGSKFKEATKKLEAEKQKLLVEKRNAESETKKAQERVEVEKLKAAREKQRADVELVKVEELKKLAEDNWKSTVEAKHLADQMSQELVEDKKTIEELKQKIYELSSPRKPNEISRVSPDVCVNADSTEVKLLKNILEHEKYRANHAKKKLQHAKKKFERERIKFEYEESHRSILQRELHHLKLDFFQNYLHLNMLDASFSPVAGSIHNITKSQNMPSMQKSNDMTQLSNLGMPQMHSCVENELMKPCSISVGVCDSLRKSMQNTPLLAISEGNYTESITGIGSKLDPLIRGSNRTMIQNYAVNSCAASFSDAHLMGSQERGALQVTASTKSGEETFNARPSMLNSSDRSVIEHDRMRKRYCDTIECIANLSSEGKKLNMQLEDRLSDLRGLLYGKMEKSVEGGRDIVSNHGDNLQTKRDRAHKKRKKSHGANADAYVDEKEETEEPKAGVSEDAIGCRQTTCPASYTQTTRACRERKFDASNNFDEVNGSVMKLLDLENGVDEERYRRARNAPLSPPSFPEIETFDMDNRKPFLEEVLHVDLLSQRDLFPSTRCDVIDVEINSNMQKFDALTVPCNAHKSTLSRQTDVKLPDMHSLDNLRATFPLETGHGSLHNQLPNFCLVLSDRENNSSISRTFHATRNCIARCSLDTQTEWVVASILTAVEVEEMSLQKEKHSVLLTLMLFNFTMTTAMKFGKFGGGNLILCLNSYAEHIRRVMTDVDTRILFLENFSLHELLCLIEDFLIEGKVIFKNIVPTETSSESDLRNSGFLDGVDTLSSEVASSEQLVAASIILASLCAATDYVGFISEASYNILRSCKWDSLTVLTILHVFANLGGRKYFDLGSCGLMVTVLKSLVMFLEERSTSVTTASCLPSINQLHSELCTNVKCPFSEGAESIDIVTLLLLEKIKNCLFQEADKFDSSNFRFLSDNYNAGQWSNQEVVPCANSMNCDGSCCLKKHLACPTQPDVLIDVTLCQLTDILSLLELVANKMSWQWTNFKLVPQLLHILDSCAVENFAVAIIVLLGQLGRLGVDVGGYEDQGVENLRRNLFSYLCGNSSMKAGHSLQIATATALFGLLPLDLETLLQTEFSLPAYSIKPVSDDAENLRKWFSGLGKNQQDLLYGVLRCTDA